MTANRATRFKNPPDTKASSVVQIPTKTPSFSALLQQYGCGPVQFSGTDNALYERHLIFDNITDIATSSARMSMKQLRILSATYFRNVGYTPRARTNARIRSVSTISQWSF